MPVPPRDPDCEIIEESSLRREAISVYEFSCKFSQGMQMASKLYVAPT
jgi:hypothetical protein